MTKSTISTRRLGKAVAGKQKQRGISFIGVFLLLAVILFFATAAFKIGPSYMEYLTVAKIAEDVSKNPELMKGSKSKVVKYINQAYSTNNLWDLKAEETIELKKDGRRGYMLKVNYEKRTNLISNIDVVTVFQKDVSK